MRQFLSTSPLLLLFLLSLIGCVPSPAPAEICTITNGQRLVVLTGAYPSHNANPWVPTNSLPAQGSVYRVDGAIRQYTANGWRPVIASRSFMIIRRMSGPGSAIISDNAGEIITLDDALPAFTMWGGQAPQTAIWASTTNGNITVQFTQR